MLLGNHTVCCLFVSCFFFLIKKLCNIISISKVNYDNRKGTPVVFWACFQMLGAFVSL